MSFDEIRHAKELNPYQKLNTPEDQQAKKTLVDDDEKPMFWTELG